MFKIARLWGSFAPFTPTGVLSLDPAGGLGGPQIPGLMDPYFSFANVGISDTLVRTRLPCCPVVGHFEYTHASTDEQTDRQTDRQIDRQAGRQADTSPLLDMASIIIQNFTVH